MSDTSIDEAKKKLSLCALARAIMARAEAAGQSVTDWLADEQHAAEVSGEPSPTERERRPSFFLVE